MTKQETEDARRAAQKADTQSAEIFPSLIVSKTVSAGWRIREEAPPEVPRGEERNEQ